MYRRLIYLISFMLVLGFAFSGLAGAAEPNFVGWWKFDETSGTIAYDSVGYSNPSWLAPVGTLNFTLFGNPQWVTGYRGNALQLDGTGDYASVPRNDFGDLVNFDLAECTLAIWVYWNGGGGWQRIFDFGNGTTGNYIYLCPQVGSATAGMRVAIVCAMGIWDEIEVSALPTNSWHHLAVTVSRSNRTMILYLDGNAVGSKTNMDVSNSVQQLGRVGSNWLGDSSYAADPFFNGRLDDFKIYSRVLTEPEIRRIADPEKASMPQPEDESTILQNSLNLQWQAGIYAASTNGHNVYFGSDFNDVNEGIGGSDKGLQTPTSYPVSGLTYGTTYYWRIDEINGLNLWRGKVWSFFIAPLEAYNPSPSDDADFVDRDADLSWTAGAKAVSHKIFFGDTYPPPFVQSQAGTTYNPGTMDFDTTYYWRIDEVNGAQTWPGNDWEFKTAAIQIEDPTLVGWWKFDDGAGTRAIDWSGYNRHGTLNGLQWATGIIDGGIVFDGTNDYVSLPVGEVISTLDAATIMVWVDINDVDNWQRAFNFGTGTTNYMYVTPSTDGGTIYAGILATGGTESAVTTTSAFPTGWHNIAMVLETGNFRLYLDAQEIGLNTTPLAVLSDLGVTTDNWLGRSEWPNDPYFDGSMDELRIYNRILSESEIRTIMTPLKAWMPIPADNATRVFPLLTLQWNPGGYAADVDGHKLYFSSDFNDVNNRIVTPITLTDPTYTIPTPPAPLESLTTYYWAVDEVNDAQTWVGDVWRFTIRDASIIDDFEHYTDTGFPRSAGTLRNTWIDGYSQVTFPSVLPLDATDGKSGSWVQLASDTNDGTTNPASPALDGDDSMKFYYDNDGTITWLIDLYAYDPSFSYVAPKYSEAIAATDNAARLSTNHDSLNIKRDWITYKLLRIPCYGDPTNTIVVSDKLYVTLQDGDGTTVTIINPDQTIIQLEGWSSWYIKMSDFALNPALNLTDIARISVGIGNKSIPVSGGRGILFFDEIQLFAKGVCIPGTVRGDFDNDCRVDVNDLQRMTELWLGQMPAMPQPVIRLDASGLPLGTLTNWTNTGSAGGVFGDFNVAYLYDSPTVAMVEGKKAVVFDGNDDILRATINAPASITGNNPFTAIYTVWNLDIGIEEWVLMWAKRAPTGQTWDGRYGGIGYGTSPQFGAAAHWAAAYDMGFDRGVPPAHTWHTIVITYEGGTDGLETILVDGIVNATETHTLDISPNDPMTAGAAYEGDPDDANDANIAPIYYLSGALAKVEVYNVYVPPENLAILTGTPIDMKQDSVINFKDLAVLAYKWFVGPVLFE